MTRDLLVAVDAGTSVIKAVVFDLAGNQLASTKRQNRYETTPGGAVEQDMARTWSDTASMLRELVDQVPDIGARAAALAVTGQGDGTWLVDAEGEPVAPALLWLDSRAAEIVDECDANGVREALFRATGCGLNPSNQSAQMAWLKRHRPELLERAASAHHCKDWLYLHLTGARVTDVSEGSFTFGDFRTRRYRDDILSALGLADCRRLLPDMVDGGETTHPLTPVAAQQTGLPAGLPVSLGYVDVICTALGSGLYEPGRSVGVSIIGSTGMHMRLVPKAEDVTLPDYPGGYTMPFPVNGAVSRMETNMAATLNIDWIVDVARQAAGLLGKDVDHATALATLDAQVLSAEPGAALFHPYIHEAGERGPFVNARARAQFAGLSNRVGFLDMMRSIYEGLGFAALDCYRSTGGVPGEIRIAGGAARSKAVRTILANVLGVPVRESARGEAGAAGAAMIAAVAIGACPDMASAVETWVRPALGDAVMPDPVLVARYAGLFPLYERTRQIMPEIWSGMAEARRSP
jgi:erythritol kinase